jgi:hypothetical protein
MRRRFVVLLATLALTFALGCGGEAKKDTYKGQDKPVPEDKKDKDK